MKKIKLFDGHALIASGVIMLAAALLIGFGGHAKAADIYTPGGLKDGHAYTADAAVPAIRWSGISVGIEGGYMNANHAIDVPAHFGEESGTLFNLDGLNSSGVIGGGTLGFDQQLGNWVLGVKAWYHLTDAETTAGLFETIKGSIEKEEEYGIALRAGRLLSPRVLAYGLAGWNEGDYSLHASAGGETLPLGEIDGLKTSQSFGGVIAGAGVEYAVTQNVIVGAEYTHWFAGEESWFRQGDDRASIAVNDDLDEDRVMLNARVKLGGGLIGE